MGGGQGIFIVIKGDGKYHLPILEIEMEWEKRPCNKSLPYVQSETLSRADGTPLKVNKRLE